MKNLLATAALCWAVAASAQAHYAEWAALNREAVSLDNLARLFEQTGRPAEAQAFRARAETIRLEKR